MGRISEYINRARNWVKDNKKKSLVIGGVAVYLATLENVIGEKWGHDWLGLKQVSAYAYENFGPIQNDVDNNQGEHDDTQNAIDGLTADVDGLQGNITAIQGTLDNIENAIYNGTNGTTPVDPTDPVDPTAPILKNSFGLDAQTLRSIIKEQGVTNVASMLGLDATLLSELADGEGANNEIVNNGSYAVQVAPTADGTQGQVTTYTIRGDLVNTVSAYNANKLEDSIEGGN